MVAINTDFYQKELFAGWIPIRFYWQDSAPFVDWCYLGQRRFVEPFFSSTIESCLNQPFNQMFRHQTAIDALAQFAEDSPGIRPTGFIFHASRCGTTMVSQALASLEKNLVLCEPDPIDSVLRSNYRNPNVTDDQRIDCLRWMVNALGQQRQTESNLFIVFDAWSAIDLPLVRRAFPDVPWAFLYRDPIEVLASQLRQRPVHTVPGMIEAALFGMDSDAALSLSPAEYCADILASVFKAGLNTVDGGQGMLINYKQLPDVIWSSMLDFMGVEITSTDEKKMRHSASLYLEHPEFSSEQDAKKLSAETLELIRRASESRTLPLYRRLESIRQASRLASNSR